MLILKQYPQDSYVLSNLVSIRYIQETTATGFNLTFEGQSATGWDVYIPLLNFSCPDTHKAKNYLEGLLLFLTQHKGVVDQHRIREAVREYAWAAQVCGGTLDLEYFILWCFREGKVWRPRDLYQGVWYLDQDGSVKRTFKSLRKRGLLTPSGQDRKGLHLLTASGVAWLKARGYKDMNMGG